MAIFKRFLFTIVSTFFLVFFAINFYFFMVDTFGNDADFLNVVVDNSFIHNRYFGFSSLLQMFREFPTDQFLNDMILDIKFIINFSLFGIPSGFKQMYYDMQQYNEFTTDVLQNISLNTIVEIMVAFFVSPIFILFGLFLFILDFLSYALAIFTIIARAFGGYYSIPYEPTYDFHFMLFGI